MSKSNGEGVIKNLDSFRFKEVLSDDVAHKVGMVLVDVVPKEDCVEETQQQQAIVILEKKPFANAPDSWAQVLGNSELKFEVQNDIYGSYHLQLPSELNDIKLTVICPATERHIEKYRYQEHFLVQETAQDYETITLPYINESQSQLSLQWVFNVLEHKAESERIVFEEMDPETGFLLAPDLKWDGKQMENLYIQAIIRKRGIKSIRDLTGDHLPLLENLREKSLAALREKYGVRPDQIKAYFHYQPSFYHLHVHFISLNYDAPASGTGKAVLLDDVINNLRIAGDFYRRATLTFSLKKGHKLLNMFRAAGRAQS